MLLSRAGMMLFIALVLLTAAAYLPAQAQRANAPRELTFKTYLPFITNNTCADFAGVTYNALAPNPPPTDRPAEQHADLNLALRGYALTNNTLGLIDLDGPTDTLAPQLYKLFGNQRVPVFSSVYRVYDWNWATNSRGALITDPPVTLAGMETTTDETLYVPASGYNIGTKPARPAEGFFKDAPNDDPNAYEVLVLYASPDRITLKYTREDNVVKGYTIHVEKICVAPALLALYQQKNAAGRAQLPALKAGQPFARARANEIGVVIRDTGQFMDPRSRKDWWAGK